MKPTQKKLLEYIIENEVKAAIKSNLVEGVNLYNIFAQPIKDIFDTAKAEVSKTAHTVASTVGSLAKQTVLFLLPYVPGITDAQAMAKVDREHKENLTAKLEQIDRRYADVIQRNWDAIASSDIGPLLFLANPSVALGAMLLAKGGKVTRDQAVNALDVANSLLGGNRFIESAINKLKNLRTQYGQAVSRTTQKGQEVDPYSTSYGDDYGDMSSVFEEQATGTQAKVDYKSYVERILNDPGVQAAFKASKPAAIMQQTAVDAIVDNASELLGFSFEDLKTNAGPQYNKIIQQVKQTPGFENKNIDTDKQFQAMVVNEIKKAIKQKAAEQLNALSRQNASLSPVVKNAIAKIQKL